MTELRRILCPIDFSDGCARALDHALALARWSDADVRLLHVYHVLPVAPFAPEMSAAALLTEEYREQIRREMLLFAERGRTCAARWRAEVLEGSPAACILEMAGTWPADLLVLGTHGRSGLQRLVLGSVTERVLRLASAPVLTVPPLATGTLSEHAPFRRILCPTDFSDCSGRALDYATSLAQQSGAALTVAHVFELEGSLPERWRDALTPHAIQPELLRLESDRRERLQRAVPDRVFKACTVDTVMTGGTPYREILRLAAERHADLIVMGVHGRNAADLLFFGSTTNHVVRQADCPVLTIRT